MMIPGVSGGTMAIILGIYDELIDAVSNVRKSPVYYLVFLANYLIGGLVGMVLLSGPLLALVQWQPVPCMFFFMGAILASIPPLFRRAVYIKASALHGFVLDGVPIDGMTRSRRMDPIRGINVIGALVGTAIGFGLHFIPEGLTPEIGALDVRAWIMLFLAGIIIAIALVLPGISGSYMLLVFGLYDVTLTAIRELDLLFLLPIVIGTVAGTFGSAKILDNLMKRHPQFIFLMIIGFMVGSLYQVFPGLPSGIEIAVSAGTFIAGFAIIYMLGSTRRHNDDETV
jgi:putative membrane protein